jgi:2-methylisocitrate lyase-like PEP mutase family enzyme
MSRRSTPERIDAEREAATRQGLIGQGLSDARADAWIAAWHTQAAEDGLERGSAYWDAGFAWITAERVRRVRP